MATSTPQLDGSPRYKTPHDIRKLKMEEDLLKRDKTAAGKFCIKLQNYHDRFANI